MLPVRGPVLGPPSLHPTLWFAAATANLEAGRDDDAAKLFERLQASYERVFDLDAYARSFYLLGGIYERRGDATRAGSSTRAFSISGATATSNAAGWRRRRRRSRR